MKKLFVSFSLVSVLVLYSCSTDPVGSNKPQNTGKIILNIDKQNAPSSVVFVKAYLTRENHQPISGSLNLQSDSTADILLNDIDAGQWHLKVDAEEDSGVVLYTGETDVQIYAGYTSQVYLTLTPTGSGTGSIYIHVTWGVPIVSNWIDYNLNPLIIPNGNVFDNLGVLHPVVLFENGSYKMWYHGFGQASGQPWKTYIFYRESNDGISWTNPTTPIILPGSGWDSKAVSPGAVIKENGIYKMYYTGYFNEYSNWHIGLATSSDGVNWTKYPQPIVYGSSGWEYQIVVSSVIKINGIYFMYYSGINLPYHKIGVATSTDGITFTKYSGNPILINDRPWEADGVWDGSVIQNNGQLKMVYQNSNNTGFGFATSTDGLNWAKESNNPFFTIQSSANNWALLNIACPFFVKTISEYRIYYCGATINSDVFRIGFMRKPAN